MPLKLLIIFLSLILAFGSAYSLYILVVCENHALSHSFFGGACPRTDFFKFLSGWRETLFILAEVALFAVILFALFEKPEQKVKVLKLTSTENWGGKFRQRFSEWKPELPLLEFIFQGRLHPQVYNV